VGKITFEKTRFSLLQTLDGVIKTLKPKADEKGIKLVFNKNDGFPKTLIGDPTRLIQIVTNLVGNAVKFTDKGYVLLNVTTNNKNENDILIEFEIEDSGVGIPKEKQELIFESFMQADSNTTRKYGGSGLGLRITKQLIELQNGNIVVESEMGKGSTFKFILPFEIPNKSDAKENLINFQSELYCLGNVKALIVEDIEVNRIIADKFLTSWGALTDFAENGKIAVEKVEEQDYDLILMDLQMPVMDGYEATQKIKELDKYKANKIPILALTAGAMTDIRGKVQDYGMDDFISKPINPNELNNKVAKHVSRKNKLLQEGNILKNNDIIDEKIVDFKYYTDLARGDNKFLNKLYEQTIIVLEEFKVNYSLLFDENNINELRSVIHKAKSSIANVNNLIETTSEGKELLLQNENNNAIRKSHLKTIHNLVDVAIKAFNRRILTLKLGCSN
jgi:CheY-like chemotaxis protein